MREMFLAARETLLKLFALNWAYAANSYTQAERGIKLGLLNFHGRMELDVFLGWLTSCNNFVAYNPLSDERMVYYATTKLKGATYIWCHRQQDMFKRSGRGEVTNWAQMELLYTQFLPLDYTQQICHIFHCLSQGDKMSVVEYPKVFFDLATGSGIYKAMIFQQLNTLRISSRRFRWQHIGFGLSRRLLSMHF